MCVNVYVCGFVACVCVLVSICVCVSACVWWTRPVRVCDVCLDLFCSLRYVANGGDVAWEPQGDSEEQERGTARAPGVLPCLGALSEPLHGRGCEEYQRAPCDLSSAIPGHVCDSVMS